MGSTFCKTLASFSDMQQWKEALRETENLMHNGGPIVLNPLTKAANAGSLAMQMAFEPIENKHPGTSAPNPLVLIAGSQKSKVGEGAMSGSNSTDFRS
jgi:hypothetical protein